MKAYSWTFKPGSEPEPVEIPSITEAIIAGVRLLIDLIGIELRENQQVSVNTRLALLYVQNSLRNIESRARSLSEEEETYHAG